MSRISMAGILDGKNCEAGEITEIHRRYRSLDKRSDATTSTRAAPKEPKGGRAKQF